jgi:hypothetical protein
LLWIRLPIADNGLFTVWRFLAVSAFRGAGLDSPQHVNQIKDMIPTRLHTQMQDKRITWIGRRPTHNNDSHATGSAMMPNKTIWKKNVVVCVLVQGWRSYVGA